ncbi:MAG: MBL fold metallo-hydrolase [Candidatus Nomurabacteria bacterium]|jgi:L-ascorbate metabolism protein UlaG (beta-lactamase superfamily)|nr:MBL fold metallo-hydrolase [Candidatus Nomurabacteria bacterium]
MEIEYRGYNCVVIKTKRGTIVVDPPEKVNVKEIASENTITLATQDDFVPPKANFVIDMPGEYEHNDISIVGIPVQRHIDPEEKGKAATAYVVNAENIRVAVLGHITSPISDDDLESLGIVNVLVVPVGGGGYTLDAHDAAAVVRQISPKAVIPTHYADKELTYEVPQETVDVFVKELSASVEEADSLKLKTSAALPEALTVYRLKRK